MRSFSSTNLWPLPKAARLPSSVQAAVLQLHHCTDPFGPILPALSTQAGLCHRRAKVKRKNVTSYCFFSIICCCFSVFVEIKKLRTKLQRLSTLCVLFWSPVQCTLQRTLWRAHPGWTGRFPVMVKSQNVWWSQPGRVPGHFQSAAEVPLEQGVGPPDAQTRPCDELAPHPGVYGRGQTPHEPVRGQRGQEKKRKKAKAPRLPVNEPTSCPLRAWVGRRTPPLRDKHPHGQFRVNN